MAITYTQDAAGYFIADKVVPVVPVQQASGKYPVYDRADLLSLQAELRAPGTQAAVGGYGKTFTSYTCLEWALAKDITQEDYTEAAEGQDPEADAVAFLVDQDLRMREKLAAAVVFSTTTWTKSTPGTLWSAAAGVPITDILKTGVSTIKTASGGFSPNTIVMGHEVFGAMCGNAQVLSAFGASYGNMKVVTPGALGTLFGMDVFIGDIGYQTAAKGATAAYAAMWGKHCWVGYISKTPSKSNPSAVYCLATKIANMYRQNKLQDRQHTMFVEVQSKYVHLQTSAPLGYLFESCVA
jgi:hypothetical protein